jgi:hypothetical protein
MITARTDIHRPSVIQPYEYQFVGIWYDPNEAIEIGGAFMLRFEREQIRAHMERTGGHWARHEHGGTCHCCGARALYLAAFHHLPSNEYIRVGEDCSYKMHMGEPERFATVRRAVKDARAAIAGKRKAQLTLSDLGLSRAWEIFQSTKGDAPKEEGTVCDLVDRLVRYGQLSDKQLEYLKALLERITNREALLLQRAAEKAEALPCPTGRVEVTGTLLTLKNVEGYYGVQTKMLVKAKDGYTLWGTKPSSLKAEIGDVITFRATVEPSSDDPKHGYFSRPTAQKV